MPKSSKIVVYNELGFREPLKITCEEAIRRAKLVHDYDTDEQALDDFMVVNWAWFEDRNEG
jgi:hypothetical protein